MINNIMATTDLKQGERFLVQYNGTQKVEEAIVVEVSTTSYKFSEILGNFNSKWILKSLFDSNFNIIEQLK